MKIELLENRQLLSGNNEKALDEKNPGAYELMWVSAATVGMLIVPIAALSCAITFLHHPQRALH